LSSEWQADYLIRSKRIRQQIIQETNTPLFVYFIGYYKISWVLENALRVTLCASADKGQIAENGRKIQITLPMTTARDLRGWNFSNL
jgi:hypothetical protein